MAMDVVLVKVRDHQGVLPAENEGPDGQDEGSSGHRGHASALGQGHGSSGVTTICAHTSSSNVSLRSSYHTWCI